MEPYFVDVWQGRLILEAKVLNGLSAFLNGDERQKAQSFRLPAMRDRFVAARGLLRQTLAGYLYVDPASLQFETGEYGKPALACGSLHFNISHTADLLLIAVADFADIGVDIEQIKPRGMLDSLARRCFSDREFQGWSRLPVEQQLETFFRLWTKKEAFVKAVGRGIALGVEHCEVELEKGGGLLSIPVEYGAVSGWKVSELTVDAGACAALVTANCDYVLRQLLIGVCK